MTFTDLSLDNPILRPSPGATASLGTVGARLMLGGAVSGGRFALVEHPIVPRRLAAPVHLHTREDEYSFILEGRWGFQLGDEVVYGEAGDLVFKPRDVWRTFCGSEPARLLEVISPAGFEEYFPGAVDTTGEQRRRCRRDRRGARPHRLTDGRSATAIGGDRLSRSQPVCCRCRHEEGSS